MITIKRVLFTVVLMMFFGISAHAASLDFDIVLDSEINEHGAFDGISGIVYADLERFENSDALFIAGIENNTLYCKLFDDIDGIQCTDILSIPVGGSGSYTMSLVTDGELSYIMLNSSINSVSSTEIFTVECDAFTRTSKSGYKLVKTIMGYSGGQCISYCDTQNVYHFLNSLKENRISLYSFTDEINTTDDTTKINIKNTISACADIMHFDIADYDYDELMKYVLNTNKNFQILTALSPGENSDDSDNIGLVNSDYIDYILTNTFRLTPVHPTVDSLVSRGFCYDNGYYYYKKAFNTYYSTEIYDIRHIYDAGSGVKFIIFTDIYRQLAKAIPEYSFAVVQTSDDSSCSLLRIGMGEILPSEDDILAYSRPAATDSPAENSKAIYNTDLRMGIMLLTIGIIGLLFAFFIVIRQKTR